MRPTQLLTTLLLLALARPALAQDGPDAPGPDPEPPPSEMLGLGESSVDRHQGEYHQEIPIEVPPFHGIEPKLSLRYSSQNGNGFVGIGWSLTGISQISRVGPKHSAPTYKPDLDIFVLDGQDLLPCTEAALSPSCKTGGDYATRVESYARIERAPLNRWVVTGRDGTRAVYGPVANTDRGVLRWGLVAVVDAHENRVEYQWAQNAPDAYPTSIRYNGTIINFFREKRPDVQTFATGATSLGRTQARLKTIDVRLGLRRARAYALSYQLTERGRQSKLSAVRKFGTDATLGPSSGNAGFCGTFDPGAICVTAGTAAPPTTLDYAVEAGQDFLGVAWASWCSTDIGVGDFNGDRRADLYCHATGGALTIAISDGKGGYTSHPTTPWCAKPRGKSAVGDFDGDGRSDLMCQEDTGRIQTATEWSGNAFGKRHTWALPYCVSHGGSTYEQDLLGFADFNGDGKTDLYCQRIYGQNTDILTIHHQLSVALSKGDGDFLHVIPYSEPTTWCDRGLNGTGERLFTGDFNGDGRSDFACLRENASLGVRLSTGVGAFSPPAVPNGVICPIDATVLPGDYNGDGKTDLLCQRTDGIVTTYFSRGNGAFGGVVADHPFCGLPSLELTAADLNGDGRTDMICRDKNLYTTWGAVSNGAGNYASVNHGVLCSGGKISAADATGDGINDLVCHLANNDVRTLRNLGAKPLLISTDNGLGGGSTIRYEPSSTWKNTNLSFVLPTVSEVTERDGRGGPSTRKYSYSGGLYDRRGRRFLGFHTVNETLPCNTEDNGICPVEITSFHQNYLALAKPEKTIRTNGAGKVLRSTVYTYAPDHEPGKLPYASNLKARWDITYDATADTTCPSIHCKRVVTTQTYDVFGNLKTRSERGDNDANGDESTTVFTYAPNTAKYIVSKVASSAVYRGLNPTPDALLARTFFAYDQPGALVSVAQIPSKGDLTQTLRWNNDDNTVIKTQSFYDIKGNLIRSQDEYQRNTIYEYDPTYHVFQTSVKNPLNQITTTGWNFLCAKPNAHQGPNGPASRSTTDYDVLCRPVLETRPRGDFTRTSYCRAGSPTNACGSLTGANAQHIRTETPAANGTAAHWQKKLLDGRGRVYQTVSQGVDGAEYYADSSYKARGMIAAQSTIYANAAGRFVTRYEYDRQDRLILKTNADQTTVRTQYNLWRTRTTDEDNRVRIEDRDARGNVLGSSYDDGTEVTRVEHIYDRLGRRRGTTDALGNTWTYLYNSIGWLRRTKDADRGVSTTDYYLNGLPQTVRDAIGAVTSITYDALGRQRSVVVKAPNKTTLTTNRTYDQVRAGYFNIGQETSLSDASGATTRDYDASGNEVHRARTMAGTTYEFSRGFDAGGRLRWATYPDGRTVGTPANPITYDTEARPVSIPGVVTDASYTAAGLPLSIHLANGTEQRSSYELGTRVRTLQTFKGPAVLGSMTYDRYPDGRIQTITSPNPGESWAYEYGAAGRLKTATNVSTPAQSQSFSFDPAGSMTANSRIGPYVYPPPGPAAPHPHAPNTVGGVAYSYNARGDCTQAGTAIYDWDAAGRLAGVTKGAAQSSFVYDGNGARASKTSAGKTTYYPASDYEVEDGVPTTTIQLGSQLVAQRTGAAITWLHTDHLGSPVLETDATGQVKARILRRPFGERISAPPALAPVVDFVGERLDEETGLIFLNARYLDPRLGRFISADTADIVAPGVGTNRFAYSGGDPVNLRDKSGHDFFGDIFGFLSGILDGFNFSPDVSGGFGGGDSDLGFGLSSSFSSFSGNSAGSSFGGAPWNPPWQAEIDSDPVGSAIAQAWLAPAEYLFYSGKPLGFAQTNGLSAAVAGAGYTYTLGADGVSTYADVFKGLGTPGLGSSLVGVSAWPWAGSPVMDDVVGGKSYLLQVGPFVGFANRTGYGLGFGTPGFFVGQGYSTLVSPYTSDFSGAAEFMNPSGLGPHGEPPMYQASDIFPGVYYRRSY